MIIECIREDCANGSPFSCSYISDWHISPNGYATKSNYLLPCEPVMGIKNLLAFEAVIFQRSNRGYGSFLSFTDTGTNQVMDLPVILQLSLIYIHSNAVIS